MRRIVFLLGMVLLVSSSSLYGQSVKKDKWVGRMMVPSGKIDTLYMYIEPARNGVKLEIEIQNAGRFPGMEVSHDEHILSFKWDYNVVIDCALYAQENGSYQGTCKDELGNKGLFAFVPSAMADSPESTRIFEDWAYYWKGKLN